MISRVLVAVDDHIFGEAIVELLKNLRWGKTHSLRVVHVIEPREAIGTERHDQYKNDAETVVTSVAANLREHFPDSTVEEKILHGHITESIVDEAFDWNADLLLIGSHGRRGIRSSCLGSASEEIVSHAPCSVVIVRKKVRRHNTEEHTNEVEVRLY